MKLLLIAFLVFIGAAGLSQNNTNPDAALVTALIALAALLYIFYRLFFKPVFWVYKKLFSRKSPDNADVADEVTKAQTKLKDIEQKIQDAERRVDSINQGVAVSSAEKVASVQNNQPLEKQKMEHLVPEHNLLILSINKSVTDGAEIYNAARYAWKLNVDKAQQADYVLAHQSGRVVGVFEVDNWLPADDSEFNGLGDADPSRWGFVGRVAPSEILMKYFNKQLPDGFIKRGAANPVRFIFLGEMDEADSEAEAPAGPSGGVVSVRGSSGRVDSDGDFSGALELDIRGLGDDDTVVYMEGDVVAEIDGQVDDTRAYENAQVSQEVAEIRSSFVKVSDDADPAYNMKATLDIFRFDAPEVLEVELPAKDGELPISFERNGVKITKAEVTFDEDGYCRVSLFATGQEPYGFSSGVSSADDEPYISPTISYDADNQFDDGLFDVKAGDKIKIAIAIGEAVALNASFEASGVADVEERDERGDDDDADEFFGDDDDDSLNVFIACIDNDDYESMLSDEGVEAAKDLLLVRVISLMDAVMEHVDSDAQFFLHGSDGQPKSAYSRDEIEEVWDLSSEDGLRAAFAPNQLNYFQIVMVVKGESHWDRGFLRASGEEDVPPFYLWGLYPNLGDYATQGYYEGDFDTGIANDPDDDSYYSGSEAMEQYGVTDTQFLLSTYGIDEE